MTNHWFSFHFRELATFGSLARLGSILEASWAVLERLGGVLERLGGILERLGGVLERLGAVLEPSWSVLERLRGVLERLGALLQAIWPEAENVEKPLVFLAFWSPGRSWKRLGGLLERLGGLLERLGGVLETSWSRLGAAAAFDAAFDAAAAGTKRSCVDRKLLRSALGSILGL